MTYSRPFIFNVDNFYPFPGDPTNPRKVSFLVNPIRALFASTPSYCIINQIKIDANQITFSMQAYSINNTQIGIAIIGEFPCPNNCQPPDNNFIQSNRFDFRDIQDVLESHNDPLFDIALAIKEGPSTSNPNSYAICSNSFNPYNPTAGGGPRRGLGDEIFISL